jgi:hypothetical protein
MTNAKRIFGRLVRLAGVVAGTMLLGAVGAGCQHQPQHDDGRVRGDQFRPDGEVRSVERFADAHAAAGARADATLHPYDFDCGDLNSLGQHKLDLMLKDDDACLPLVVYVDVPQGEGEGYDARRDSVAVYLKDRGLQDGQVKLVAGPNVSYMHPTASALRAKRLLDTGAPVAINPEPTGSPSNAGMGAH